MNITIATIQLPPNEVSHIESYAYEVTARKSLLQFCFEHEINVNNPVFKRYHDQYVEYTAQYEILKSMIYDKYVKEKYPNSMWNLDFSTGILNIMKQEENNNE